MEEAEMFSLSILVVLLRLLLLLSASVLTLRVNCPGSDTFQGSRIPGPIQSQAKRFALTVYCSFTLKSTFGLVQVT